MQEDSKQADDGDLKKHNDGADPNSKFQYAEGENAKQGEANEANWTQLSCLKLFVQILQVDFLTFFKDFGVNKHVNKI